MKKWILLVALLCSIKPSFAQTLMTLCEDGTFKVYTDYEQKVHADRCKDGKRLLIDDSTRQILVITTMKDCRMNGIYKRFYKNEILKELGNYLNGKKNGSFYFWNQNGVLIRKEIWRSNKRLKTIKQK